MANDIVSRDRSTSWIRVESSNLEPIYSLSTKLITAKKLDHEFEQQELVNTIYPLVKEFAEITTRGRYVHDTGDSPHFLTGNYNHHTILSLRSNLELLIAELAE